MAIFTAIGAAIFGAGTFLASLTSTVLAIAVNVGLSLLQKALAGDQSQEPAGVNGKLQAGGDVPRSFIVGRTCTAGSLAYANTWGTANKTPNAYFTQVIALADHQISNLTGFWVNDAPVTVDTSNPETDKGYPITEYRKDGKDYLWLKWYDGTQTTADPFLVASVSSAGRPYESTRVGTGVAYAIVTSRTNTELFSGFPSFKFEVQGRALYDVSKDTTEGGSGPQRWNDKTTWGGDGDDLPAVQIYNVLRGIYEANVWLYGLQTITAPRLPAADWIAQIAKCRLEVDGAGQGVQYLTGGEISVDTEIGTAIEKILTGCQGRLIESGGVYKIRVGEPDAAVMSFSDGDILSSEEQTFTPFFGLSDTINGVTATYPEPEEAWNTKAAPPIYNPDYEAQDGNRRLMTSVQMDMVYRSIQVQRVMKAALAEARRARRHTFIMPPAYWVLEPGDIVQWTSARNGYVSKLFRVDGIGDGENLDVTVDMTEVDPTDYSWDPDTDYKPPVFSPVGPVHPPTQVMSGWSVAPYTI
ncbi:phage tail protein, partial [Mesorhizobium sp. BR1-1-7]|uniref:phage tail protein n=1 Tax=Mesorhizobium sp. BR1-1-7 TaxID=2876647 RepID=UPI001CCFDC02